MAMRIEKDALGEVKVPAHALWGAQTQRSLENFKIGSQTFPALFIKHYAELKKAAAIVNHKQGKLKKNLRDAIVTACDEIISGKHHDAFPLVIWQTGSGTQTNMNLNEVIAHRANHLLAKSSSVNQSVHPNDHVNLSQSSNDSFPTVMHITSAWLVKQELLPATSHLLKTLSKKQKQFKALSNRHAPT